MKSIYIATEDELSEVVVKKLIDESDGKLHVSVPLRGGGFGYLKNKLPELVKLAPHIPVVLLADLDSVPCPPRLISSWLGSRPLPEQLLFRVAVREIEAWLLSDQEGFSEFFLVPKSKISDNPEIHDDPKCELLNLISRYSKCSDIRNDVVTNHGSGPQQGFFYNSRLSQFVNDSWCPERASEKADSLRRARQRIQELAES